MQVKVYHHLYISTLARQSFAQKHPGLVKHITSLFKSNSAELVWSKQDIILKKTLKDKVFHHFSISGGLVWSKQPGAEQRSNRQNLNSRNISTSSESMTRHGGRWQQWALVKSLLCRTKLAWWRRRYALGLTKSGISGCTVMSPPCADSLEVGHPQSNKQS